LPSLSSHCLILRSQATTASSQQQAAPEERVHGANSSPSRVKAPQLQAVRR
jgi:hypothetical protein